MIPGIKGVDGESFSMQAVSEKWRLVQAMAARDFVSLRSREEESVSP